jgi:hypothetical protein
MVADFSGIIGKDETLDTFSVVNATDGVTATITAPTKTEQGAGTFYDRFVLTGGQISITLTDAITPQFFSIKYGDNILYNVRASVGTNGVGAPVVGGPYSQKDGQWVTA